MNRLDLVAGPNAAGKSTFVELTMAPPLAGSVFVNADEIANRRWPNDPTAHAVGYTVVLHVLLIPEELALARLAAGGHLVAQNKIREHYHRLWAPVAGPDERGLHRRLPRVAGLDTAGAECAVARRMIRQLNLVGDSGGGSVFLVVGILSALVSIADSNSHKDVSC